MKTILIVDDEPTVRKPLQEFFQISGYQILTAENADEAFDHLNESHIDLMITNISMPGMDGIELTRIVTERYNVKVIVTTGMHDCHDEAIAAGAIEFVRKPVRFENFEKLVESILNNQKLKFFRSEPISNGRETADILEEKGTTKDIIKTIIGGAITFIGGAITITVVWSIFQFEELKTIIRFSFFFLFWLIFIYATIFYESDWKNFSFRHDWLKLVIQAILVVFWTIIFYLAAFYGIGLEEGPWENV